MSGMVKVLFLLMVGVACGMGYNAWPLVIDADLPLLSDIAPRSVDMASYAMGLAAGMALWSIAGVPWVELPARVQSYLAAQVHFYQFVVLGGACLAILIYA